jgi:hypothetical protein
MDAMVTDPDRALAMGRTARERVLADFSTKAHLERLAAAYDAAAAHRRSAA